MRPTARCHGSFWASDAVQVDDAGAADVAVENSRHLAVAGDGLQSFDNGALEREVALPQAEHHRIARQFWRDPVDAPTLARRDLASEQALGDADIEAAI